MKRVFKSLLTIAFLLTLFFLYTTRISAQSPPPATCCNTVSDCAPASGYNVYCSGWSGVCLSNLLCTYVPQGIPFPPSTCCNAASDCVAPGFIGYCNIFSGVCLSTRQCTYSYIYSTPTPTPPPPPNTCCTTVADCASVPGYTSHCDTWNSVCLSHYICTYTPIVIPPGPTSAVQIGSIFHTPWGNTKGLADLVSVVLSNAVVIAGVILFILLLVGGIMVIAGAGSGNKEGVGKGRAAVTAAVIGFLIIFTAYWIILIMENVFRIQIRSGP